MTSTPTATSTKRTKKCGSCKVAVKDKDKGLQCEYCSFWFHDTCESVDETRYDVITASGEQTHWFCKKCNLKVMDTLLFIQNVKDDNEKMRAELSTIKTQVNDMANKFEAELKTKPSYQEVDAMLGDKLADIPDTGEGASGTTHSVIL